MNVITRIIEKALDADKAALMNRLRHVATQSKADAESTSNDLARNAALARHAAACNALDNVYWNDTRGIAADCAQYVITLHEAGKITGASRQELRESAEAWEAAR
jgi:hypothetical protein